MLMTPRMSAFAFRGLQPARGGGSRWASAAIAVTAVLITAFGAVAPAAARAATGRATPRVRAACPAPRPGYARCFALLRPQATVNEAIAAGVAGAAARPKGWSPQAIRSAYKLPDKPSAGQTVAVSIAFHTPRLASYLARYRSYYHLPPCTVNSGCFRQVNQQGQTSPAEPSSVGSGWDLEATLDVSMISVTCPQCKILVVEAREPSIQDLGATERTAARLGAQVISNSYGAAESGFSQALADAYYHHGHTIVAAAGDTGFGPASFPANQAAVIAVGGTELSRARNARGWKEEAWNTFLVGAGGSGCSAYVAKPSWQTDTHCTGRTVADVSAVAASIPVYNSDWGGWVTLYGTSAATPLIAGMYGLAGNGATATPRDLYARASHLFEITKGSNAFSGPPRQVCGNDYLCTARKGYDAPTGLGTPNGISAF